MPQRGEDGIHSNMAFTVILSPCEPSGQFLKAKTLMNYQIGKRVANGASQKEAPIGSRDQRLTCLDQRIICPASVLSVVTGCILGVIAVFPAVAGAEDRVEEQFRERIQPILNEYCISCHEDGSESGGLVLNEFTSNLARIRDGKLWWAVLRNVRAGLMPPLDNPRPTDTELRVLEDWIKHGPFAFDPENSKTRRAPMHRLNQVEYRNTIYELMGVDYDTKGEFPPDDSGYGFDNIAEVLTLSPLLMEKYFVAAKSIVTQAVPTASEVVVETKIAGQRFHSPNGVDLKKESHGAISLSYYQPALATSTFHAEHPGRYQLVLDLTPREMEAFGRDSNQCRVRFKVDGQELFQRDFSRHENVPFHHQFYQLELDLSAGEHELAFTLEPLTPDEKQLRNLEIRINSVVVRGPLERQFWARPANYSRFFPSDVPEEDSERRLYSRDLLHAFAKKAFRRPVDDMTVNRLVELAERESSLEGVTFEVGIAQAMAAVLVSPRFLLREEEAEKGSSDQVPLVDEYALASRLSYFLWSSMPDDELFRLAEEHALRKNLPAQMKRMLADPRSREFIRNFVGQWLRARDIKTVPINAFAVIHRDQPSDFDAIRSRMRWQELGRRFSDTHSEDEKQELNEARASYFKSFRRFHDQELNGELRMSMNRETEMLFDHIIHQDRSLRDLLISDYTFLDARLAKHYGIDGVEGPEMRRVSLPANSPRGGVLTQGTVLAVTSNPDRTSPVKRGLFILSNILGIPPQPPPPNTDPLEEAAKEFANRTPTLRETLEMHRKKPECKSCHDRMDPLGLALENFNALGQWREREQGETVDSTGRLITGEAFVNIQELKRILVDHHSRDFFRCLSEKMLTYALGRGLDFRDVETLDSLVDRIERENGRASALVYGIIESPQFQRYQYSSAGNAPNQIDRSPADSAQPLEPRKSP